MIILCLKQLVYESLLQTAVFQIHSDFSALLILMDVD